MASHKAFPRDVVRRLPRRLPPCVVDAVRPAYLASTPLVLATGNDQQQLMQWLLQQGADPELGAPLLLCAGRFCRGSRTCCVSTLLRRGARPNVAWADNPLDSPLYLAARGDCFTHVHCLVAYGADVGGEAARVREALLAPAAWEEALDVLLRRNSGLLSAPGAEALLCPCGQQHGSWPGLWPLEGEDDGAEFEAAAAELQQERDGGGAGDGVVSAAAAAEAGAAGTSGAPEGSSGNSCHNQTPSDDAWYRHNRVQMEQLQDGNELADCRKAVDDLWHYGCSAVAAELGGTPGAPHSLMPQRVLDAMQDVAGGWLAAALRCRQQRQLRQELYDDAVAAGRRLLEQKRLAALAALGGAGLRGEGCGAAAEAPAAGSQNGLVVELRMEIMVLAGLAPPGLEARVLSEPTRRSCDCAGCTAASG
ncbi:hypothetical protein GPECTOR_21g739 [Gonium pectorale]|uniref:Uncharacterized protein n=1 Tax=Gonium pectorale TaxID=33097 RepID=A0A150GI72_GONPE|nr:hypothetical protein GPECTOR_21g739 [Gonium pectorale]|eukprot:KXZ49513.1 hypothetical protein GPECTOR_21g739 [Gonium pectorale]